MTNSLSLHSIGNGAADIFTKLHDTARVSFGSNTNKMRAMGHSVDSIVLDCHVTNQRIGVMLADGASEFVIAIAEKDNLDNAEQVTLPLAELTTHTLLKHMEAHFAK